MHEKEVHVTACLVPALSDKQVFKVPEDAPLLRIMQTWSVAAGAPLLPNSDAPLDRLHNIRKHDQVGPSIDNLDQAVGEFISEKDTSHDFGVELVRAFRVNTRWFVASQELLSPKDILVLAGLNYQEYSLYREGSSELLPLETPVSVARGNVFEAQRDGRYGGANGMS